MSRNGLINFFAVAGFACVLQCGCNRPAPIEPLATNSGQLARAGENGNSAPSGDSSVGTNEIAGLVIQQDEERARGLLPKEPTPVNEIKDSAPPHLIQSGQQPWINIADLPIEAWYSQYVANQCVGISRVSIKPPLLPDSNTMRLSKHDVIETRSSDGATHVKVVVLESLERPNGDLLSFSESTSVGDVVVNETSGEFNINTFSMTTLSDGKSTSNNIAWPEGAWGPFGTMAMVKHQAQPGLHYQGQMLVPQLGQFAQVDLRGSKPELTTLPGGVVMELIPVEAMFTYGQNSAKTKNWLSESGQIMKTVSPEGFTLFSVSQTEAEQIESEMRVAELLPITIAVKSPIAACNEPQVIYQVEANKRDPFMLFSRNVNQIVRSITARNAEVLVVETNSEELPGKEFTQDKPSSNCSDSSKLIDLEHTATRSLVNELAGDNSDPLSIAATLTQGVFDRLKKNSLSRKFLNSKATVSATSGDCVTHAVLLTTLVRSRGIPARVASGLRLTESGDKSEAIYHMWCEAWIADRWLPLDPYLGTVGVGADHLKLFESDLSGENPYDAILPVLQLLPQLSIAVKAV